jgi:thymidylate kinase
LKTKLLSLVVAVAVAAASDLSLAYAAALALAIVAVHSVAGVFGSVARRRNPLNDAPNTLRIALASLGGLILLNPSSFLFPSLGVFMVFAGVFLNDEFQRRAMDSVSKKRRGGTVVLLGIDGSGKSTHARALNAWFKERGYFSTLVPFHRYLFLDFLRRTSKNDVSPLGNRRGGNPLRPILSLFDNLLFYLTSSFGRGLEGRVVIYDRFIWSTFIKYNSLGYPVKPLRWLYMLPHPRVAIVLDIPTERSLGVIQSRATHIRYTAEVLNSEREEYLALARGRNCPVVDSGRSFDIVQREIEQILAGVYPSSLTGGTG